MILTKNYLRKNAIFDILANFPLFIYTLSNGLPSSEEEVEKAAETRLFVVVMALKSLRLLHSTEVSDALKRIMNLFSDIFYMHKYMFENILRWILAGTKFLLAVHYFACGWILIHHYKGQAGSVQE